MDCGEEDEQRRTFMKKIRNRIFISALVFAFVVATLSANFVVAGFVIFFAGLLCLIVSRKIQFLMQNGRVSEEQSTQIFSNAFKSYFLVVGVAMFIHPLVHLGLPRVISNYIVISISDALTHIPLFVVSVIIFRTVADIFAFRTASKYSGIAVIVLLSLVALILHALSVDSHTL